jgi:hypothetical protein
MNRRNLLKLGTLTLVGCNYSKKPQNTVLKAGPFSLTVMSEWAHAAVIEKVPIQPLYSHEAWKAYQENVRYSLKASYMCRPEHWALRLPSALPKGVLFDRQNSGDDSTAPQILIHKASEWAVAFTDGVHEETKTAELLANMRKDMDQSLTRDDPHLSPGFMDASLTFMCLKRRIDFTGGHGVRLLVQWTIEPDLMRLGELHYLFLGMSDDNSCQIIATFPLGLPGLPSSDDKKHLGRSIENYADLSKSFDLYEADAKHWLEQHVLEITPSLQSLDEMMKSLVASHWS